MTPRTHPSLVRDAEFWRGVFSPVLLGFALAGSIIALVVTIVMRQEGAANRARPAPYHYVGLPYQAAKASICPGDTLAFTATVEIREPTSMTILHTIADETGRNVRGWYEAIPAIYDQPTPANAPIVIPERIEVPVLPPGRYRLLGTREKADTEQEVYRIPFDVPAGCP